MGAELQIAPSRPRGRPSLYNPVFCDRVLELAAEGCGKAEIAATLGVTAKTLSSWAKAHEEFREAMIHAKELEYAWWLAAGRKGQFMRNWNASGWALQMRNRFGKRFRDRIRPKDEADRKGDVNADQLRDEIERKLSRVAAAGKAEGVPVEFDGQGVGSPSV